MDNNIYWTLFTETGAPEFYLLYRATTQSPPHTHRTDPSYETASHHPLSARSLSPSLREVPLPEGEARAGWKLQASPQTEI